MNSESKKYKVAIFGEQYTLVSDESEDLVERSVVAVNTLMHDIAAKAPSLDTEKIAMLALLQIALKHHTLEQNIEKQRQKEEELIKFIDTFSVSGSSVC